MRFRPRGRRRGELIDWEGQPLAVGEIRASADAANAPTVLCYGHFDVQPPDPLELWESSPFEPEVRGPYLYARGVADDKGQLYLLLCAARELARAGRLPVNVRFTCDGEEETGGHSIIDFLAADDRGADAAVIFDSEMVAPGVPAFNIATRGLAYFHVELSTGGRDLHSGHLRRGCAQRRPRADGDAERGRGPGRTSGRARSAPAIAAPSAEELDGWRRLPPGAEQLADQGARPADQLAAEEFYLRTFAEPALDVNGIESGSPRLQKTVLPVHAVANVSIRLAPGQDVRRDRQCVRGRAPGCRARRASSLNVQLLSSAQPGLVAPDAPAVQLAQDAFERVIGARPLLIRTRRDAADRPGPEQPRDPSHRLRLLASRREHPLAQRAPPGRVRATRHRHRAGAARGVRAAVARAVIHPCPGLRARRTHEAAMRCCAARSVHLPLADLRVQRVLDGVLRVR